LATKTYPSPHTAHPAAESKNFFPTAEAKEKKKADTWRSSG